MGNRTKEEKLALKKKLALMEYGVIANSVDTICLLCAANREMVVDHLTGILWSEEEAKGIKASNGRFTVEDMIL
jgi:hypothetical protein